MYNCVRCSYHLWCNDLREIKFPMVFEDGSVIVEHENVVAVVSIREQATGLDREEEL